MGDIYQIGGIAAIILLMLFAGAVIADTKDNREMRRLSVLWVFVLVVTIGQIIF